MSDAPARSLTCGNCELAEGRHQSAELAAKAEAAGHPIPPLHCHLNPAPVPKRPEDWCGQHSSLQFNRMQKQAVLIAAELGLLAATLNRGAGRMPAVPEAAEREAWPPADEGR